MVSLAKAVRFFEQIHFEWAQGAKQSAKTDIVQCLTMLNQVLKEYGEQGKELGQVQRICRDAMELYSLIKQDKPFSLDTSVQWLSSRIDSSYICPPVLYDNIVVDVEEPLPDESTLPETVNASFHKIMEQDWSTSGVSQIYQDLLEDCSFVTALISLLRNNSQQLMSAITPHASSERFGVTLYFNGCRRLVEIGNTLPFVENDTHSMFVRSSTNNKLYWPALLEKAYLKVHGYGYDFKGSNSSIDTYMLSGWIPQFIVSYQVTDLEPIWDQLYEPFINNKVVLALGTASDSYSGEYKSNHDYSIAEMDGESRNIVIKNPWRRSETVIRFEEIFDHFETLYLNWNPQGLIHKSINLISSYDGNIWFKFPQFKVSNSLSSRTFNVKLLLERHLKRSNNDASINVGIFKTSGERLFRKGIPKVQTFANNTNFHTSEFTLEPLESVTVVVFYEATSFPETFTLHSYSTEPVALTKAAPKFPYTKTLEGHWDLETCGGNWSFQTYVRNPQYEVVVPECEEDVQVTMSLHCELDSVLVNMQLFFDDTSSPFKSQSLIMEKYSTGSMTCNLTLTSQQRYKLVVSTYEQDILTNFKLIVNSSSSLQIQPISTRLGLYVKPFKFQWKGKNRFKLLMKVSRETVINVHLWTPQSSMSNYRPKIRASLFYKNDSSPIQINNDFDDHLFGIWLRNLKIDSRSPVILLIERFEAGYDELQGQIGSNQKLELV